MRSNKWMLSMDVENTAFSFNGFSLVGELTYKSWRCARKVIKDIVSEDSSKKIIGRIGFTRVLPGIGGAGVVIGRTFKLEFSLVK